MTWLKLQTFHSSAANLDVQGQDPLMMTTKVTKATPLLRQMIRRSLPTTPSVRRMIRYCCSVSHSSHTGCAIKQQCLGKNFQILDASIMQQWQRILQILLKRVIWFNRYNSLNFKIHFFRSTRSCAVNIRKK